MAEAEANPTEKETTRVRSITFLCAFFLESLCVPRFVCVRARVSLWGVVKTNFYHILGVCLYKIRSAFQCLNHHTIFFYI